MSEFNWKCPYCGKHQVVVDAKLDEFCRRVRVGKNPYGYLGVRIYSIGCSNPECLEVTLSLSMCRDAELYTEFRGNEVISHHSIWPRSNSKPQPDYIPKGIVEDYVEACLIRDLSPKASATLSRRCVQGIIRDFCGITKNRLVDEINELKRLVENGKAPQGVTIESVNALDHVRSVGNIGAHMEKDIDLIIDVDPNEADTLIQFVELLFDEWYIARETRRRRLEQLQATANNLAAKKGDLPPN